MNKPEWTHTKTIQHGSCTINIYRPVLTERERAKQESRTREALERVMSAYLHKREVAP